MRRCLPGSRSMAIEPEGSLANQQYSWLAVQQSGSAVGLAITVALAEARAARRPGPPAAPPPVDAPRTAVTAPVAISTQERLREASHRLRREKQHIVDEALLAWLEEHGY